MPDTTITIRKAAPADAEHIIAIQKRAFQRYVGPLTPEQIPPLHESLEAVRIDIERKTVLVALSDQLPAGSVRCTIKGGVCMIERLSVDPAFQRNGIGKALMNAIEKEASGRAHKLHLETGLLADNLLPFYARLGYVAEALLPQHYGGFDWIALAKQATAAGPRLETLSAVRAHIDAVDRVVVRMLAHRIRYVQQAARFKRSSGDVRDSARVEEVIGRIRNHAQENAVNPDMIENMYRTMIEYAIRTELKEHARIAGTRAGHHA